MKKIWAIRKDAEGVSPVIATILMVAITVVLAAVLYVMVLGFGGTTSTPSVSVQKKSTISNGYKFEFTAPTSEVKWTDVTIQLSVQGSTTAASWSPTTEDLTDSTPPATKDYGSATAGTLHVSLNVTDLAGNGRMSQGDYITLTLYVSGEAFSSSATYTLTLLYEVTDGSMLSYEFTG